MKKGKYIKILVFVISILMINIIINIKTMAEEKSNMMIIEYGNDLFGDEKKLQSTRISYDFLQNEYIIAEFYPCGYIIVDGRSYCRLCPYISDGGIGTYD